MNTIETPITKEKVAALVADAFQDSEYFLPKIALQDQLGLDVEVISLKRDPIEIYSNFLRQINDQKKLRVGNTPPFSSLWIFSSQLNCFGSNPSSSRGSACSGRFS